MHRLLSPCKQQWLHRPAAPSPSLLDSMPTSSFTTIAQPSTFTGSSCTTTQRTSDRIPDAHCLASQHINIVKENTSKARLNPSCRHHCNHPSIPHYIHLPQQITLVDNVMVDANNLCRFLCHLYFSSHYCYPPFFPKTNVDLEQDCACVSISFPPITSLDWSLTSPQLRIIGHTAATTRHSRGRENTRPTNHCWRSLTASTVPRCCSSVRLCC